MSFLDLLPGRVLPVAWRNWAKRLLRRSLLRQLPRHSAGAEVGTWRGEFAAEILDIVDPRELHLIDPWAASPGLEVTPHRVSQDAMDAIYGSVVRQFEGHSGVFIHRKTSEDAAHVISDRALDWVYIDGNHSYEFVRQDLELWLPKLRPGGLLTGDDYTWGREDGYPVKRAVDELVASGRAEWVWRRRGKWILREGG
jgi:hypothetical protein